MITVVMHLDDQEIEKIRAAGREFIALQGFIVPAEKRSTPQSFGDVLSECVDFTRMVVRAFRNSPGTVMVELDGEGFDIRKAIDFDEALFDKKPEPAADAEASAPPAEESDSSADEPVSGDLVTGRLEWL